MPSWKKVLVSGSDASLNSLQVLTSVSASVFTGSFTGSLFGTASWATNFITGSVTSASYAFTASSAVSAFTASSSVSSSLAISASYASSSTYALTASYALNASIDTSSFAITGSNIFTGSQTISGSQTILLNQLDSFTLYNDISTPIYPGEQMLQSSQTGTFIKFISTTNDISIDGVTVGKGPGSYYDGHFHSENIVLGTDVLSNNNGGSQNVGIGDYALGLSIGGEYNTAVGYSALYYSDGLGNTGIGYYSLSELSSSLYNDYNTAIGYNAGVNLILGKYNTFLGSDNNNITSGSYNTIIGSQITGLPSTLNNNIILSDGSGNIKYRWDETQNNIYGNLYITGSVSASNGFTGSLFGTASWAYNALTASTADNFVVRGTLTGSNALFTGTVTAQTLVVQKISSSIIYSSGSNIFGNDLTNTQVFTGSVSITGSLNVNGRATISDLTGSLFGTASWALNAIGAASFPYTGSAQITGSLGVTGSTSLNSTLNTSTVITSAVGSNTILTQATGSYTSAFFKYAASSGSNARAGEVVAIINGTSVQYTDYSTVDIGNTATLSTTASLSAGNLLFTAQTSLAGWTIKALATYI